MRILSSISLLLIVFITSCRTQKEVTYNYLQNTADTTFRDSVLFSQPLIRKGDLLSIRVYSAAHGIDPRADAPFNLNNAETSASSGLTAQGILVNEDGNIEYPQIGIVRAEGLTREQLAEEIRKRLQGLLTQPSVIVRFLNFRVTVLGEVRSPGTFNAPSENINLFEALGLAGDITEFGLKKTVKVYRENNGQRQIGTVDLTSAEVFNSPFYRLQQNDIVMVEQSKRRAKQQERQDLVQQIAIGTSILTALALLLNLIR